MQTLGLRHAAINVKDAQASKRFYMEVLRMELEWEPDPQNVYLTSAGHDNLAIHEVAQVSGDGNAVSERQLLDHLGIALPTPESVDDWYAHISQALKTQGGKVLREVKAHRDGAKSFYFADPDGVVVQMIYHPPIARRAAQGA